MNRGGGRTLISGINDAGSQCLTTAFGVWTTGRATDVPPGPFFPPDEFGFVRNIHYLTTSFINRRRDSIEGIEDGTSVVGEVTKQPNCL